MFKVLLFNMTGFLAELKKCLRSIKVLKIRINYIDKVRECVMKSLNVNSINELRDKFEGVTFYEAFYQKISGIMALESVLCGVGYAATLLVHIKHNLFKTWFNCIGVTTFVSASPKGRDERRNGIVPLHAAGPILSTRPPNVVFIARRIADAIIFNGARTLDLKWLVVESWERLWNYLQRKSDFLNSKLNYRGPGAQPVLTHGFDVAFVFRGHGLFIRDGREKLQTRSQPRGQAAEE